jgi:hypothetical protein
MDGVSSVASAVVLVFLRPTYTEDDIAQLPDSDGDNEVADEYDEMTRQSIVQPERGPFQNYVVSMFPIC